MVLEREIRRTADNRGTFNIMARGGAFRKVSEYRRRAATREPYDVVLIVCEGKKTEPLYLSRLRRLHRLSSANIEILPSPGQDPMSIVNYTEERREAGDFDCTFCVFDRDGHAGYDQALRRVSDLQNAGKNITAITSWPCFEVWLLLHFAYTSRPFSSVPNTSACEMVIRDLKTYLPNYDKGRAALYDELLPYQVGAIMRAQRLEEENVRTATTNPSTGIHSLVRYLINLKAG